MINKVSSENIDDFITACKFEHIFGSRALTAIKTFSDKNTGHCFYIGALDNGKIDTAIYINDGIATISSNNQIDINELANFLKSKNLKEIDTNLAQCNELQTIIGGEIESSFYMKYIKTTPPPVTLDGISQTTNIREIFNVLQQSHEYYRKHLIFEKWGENIKSKLEKNQTDLFLLIKNGKSIGTGSIVSEDDECGVLAAIAVIPEERGKGYGNQIACYLTSHIMKKGKIPMLISGYDEVANMYRKIGYCETGRWGELYL